MAPEARWRVEGERGESYLGRETFLRACWCRAAEGGARFGGGEAVGSAKVRGGQVQRQLWEEETRKGVDRNAGKCSVVDVCVMVRALRSPQFCTGDLERVLSL